VAAGVAAVGITTGQPRDVLLAAGACLLVDDFHQLLQVALADASSKEEGAAVEPLEVRS
jgi:phosphoglycolate phosphatase-like HAD superfamily hydrolase